MSQPINYEGPLLGEGGSVLKIGEWGSFSSRASTRWVGASSSRSLDGSRRPSEAGDGLSVGNSMGWGGLVCDGDFVLRF